MLKRKRPQTHRVDQRTSLSCAMFYTEQPSETPLSPEKRGDCIAPARIDCQPLHRGFFERNRAVRLPAYGRIRAACERHGRLDSNSKCNTASPVGHSSHPSRPSGPAGPGASSAPPACRRPSHGGPFVEVAFQRPGTVRVATSAGRSTMRVRLGNWPRRSVRLDRGRRASSVTIRA